jgi:hypothetical protein
LEEAREQLRAVKSRLPAVQRWVEDLRPRFETGAAEDRKRVVAAVIEAMRINFSNDTVELRVRTASHE